MICDLNKWDDDRLKMVCATVEDVDDEGVQRLIQDMHDTLKATGNGVGLAAPQVARGAKELLRVMIIKPDARLPGLVLINPEIIWQTEDLEVAQEGCLSYPGVFTDVPRHRSVKVRYITHRGEPATQLFTRVDARIVQHELDHLEGVCVIRDAWRNTC